MPISTIIRDGTGTRYDAQVTSDHALKVSPVTIATADQTLSELTLKKQYRDWLRNSSGSENMNVNGSVTPVLFEETAEPGKVKWITAWRLIMHNTYMEIDTNDFRRFGTAAVAPGLTNGLEFYFEQSGRHIDVFLEPVKNIGDFLQYADDYESLVNAVAAQTDYLHFIFRFDQPVALPAGSNDKIVMKVNDNLTSVDLMKVVVRGWQEFL